jgi:ADP-ribose pyrophosphatase YjhB (NUDIX family)
MVKQVYSYYNRIKTREAVDFKYCPKCQTRMILKESGGQERPTCTACGFTHFQNPLPAVCVAILDGDHILLGKRAGPPGEGRWAIPSGYIEFDDDFISTAIQEAKEETGLDVEIQSVFNVISSFYSPKYHFLVIYLIAQSVGGELQAGDDMSEVAWFHLKGPLPDLAFKEDIDTIQTFADQRADGILIREP